MGLLDQASLVVTPNAYKASKLYSVIPTNGTGDLDVVRATSATRVNSAGLIEIPVTNLLLQSEVFTNGWTLESSTISANTTIAPNGTLTADTLSEVFANDVHRTYRSAITTIVGQNYALSFYVKKDTSRYVRLSVVQSSATNVWSAVQFDLDTKTFTSGVGSAGGTFINASILELADGWFRISMTGTATSTSTFFMLSLSNGSAILSSDSRGCVAYLGNTANKIIIWGAQLEEGITATEYIPTTTVVRTRFAGITQDGSSASNIPRLDYTNASCPSILVEPQRTNSIRNSSMVGAVVGSPGTLPTNWLISATLNQTIVSKGVENGLDYIDYKLSGTASSTNSQLQFEGTNIINASNSQTWAFSLYAKIISASNPPLNYQIRFREATATGTFVADGIQTISITNSFQRFSFVRTNTGATTERIQPMLLFGTTVGQVYDFTVRIYAPQMELGSNATSYIPTTTASVTRNADVISKTGISSLIGQTEGTLYWEGRLQGQSFSDGVARILLSISDGTINNRIEIYRINNVIQYDNVVGGAIQFAAPVFTITDFTGQPLKLAMTYTLNNVKVFINGVLINTDTTALIPACNQINIGCGRVGTAQWSGLIKGAVLLPLLTNTQAIQLTTL